MAHLAAAVEQGAVPGELVLGRLCPAHHPTLVPLLAARRGVGEEALVLELETNLREV